MGSYSDTQSTRQNTRISAHDYVNNQGAKNNMLTRGKFTTSHTLKAPTLGVAVPLCNVDRQRVCGAVIRTKAGAQTAGLE